ncbi:hypothetical protein MKY15_19980 [Sporosarcina sp. FSL K6-1540]|uniref:hypothetical protein n=1 Tax=Sporosarcina sp. FSL K6-1540 TaxID=2921555 RepID=UPI00315AB8DC
MKIKTYSNFDELQIVHIFDIYDFPLFYISRSPKKEYYMNFFVDEDEETQSTTWFFSRITTTELDNIIYQRISSLSLLDNLLNQDRLNKIWLQNNPVNLKSQIKFEEVTKENKVNMEFPQKHFVAEYDYANDTKLYKVEKTTIDSGKFKITLKDKTNSHDLPIDTFIDLCTFMKKSVNKAANHIVESLDNMRRHSEELVSLKVSAIQQSSFAVWFTTDDHDLFEIPDKSLNIFVEFLDDITKRDSAIIEEKIDIDKIYSLEMVKETNKFLKELVKDEYSFSIDAKEKPLLGEDFNENKKITFDKNSYHKLAEIDKILRKKNELKQEVIKIEGILTSVNIKSNNFRIERKNALDIYGKFEKTLYKELKKYSDKQFIIPSTIVAEVLKISKVDHIEEINDEKYQLISFTQEKKSIH